MESRVKLFGHPVHPMLVVFPLGLFATSVVFDIIGGLDNNGYWSSASYYMIGAGVISGMAASAVGTIDLLAIPAKTRAKRIGLFHGAVNIATITMFAASWLMRNSAENREDTTAVLVSIVGIAIGTLGGWLGGELVYRLGVGVDKDAQLDAPNSIRK